MYSASAFPFAVRHSVILLALFVLCGCQTLTIPGFRAVTKMVLVRPVEAGGEAVDAEVEFLGARTVNFYLEERNKDFDLPFSWHTERLRDGTLRITWTTRENAREGVYLTEAGFYPAEVPQKQISVVHQRGSAGHA